MILISHCGFHHSQLILLNIWSEKIVSVLSSVGTPLFLLSKTLASHRLTASEFCLENRLYMIWFEKGKACKKYKKIT